MTRKAWKHEFIKSLFFETFPIDEIQRKHDGGENGW